MTRQPRTPDEEILQRPELDDDQRLARIQAELDRGFDLLRDVDYAISMFGSARVPSDHRLPVALADTAEAITGRRPDLLGVP